MQRFSVAREAIIKNGDLRRPDITKDKDIDTTFLMPYSWLQTRKNRPKSARNHTVFLMVFISGQSVITNCSPAGCIRQEK